MKAYLFIIGLTLFCIACTQTTNKIEGPDASLLVDSAATPETVNLFKNLKKVGEEKILIGQTDANMMGINPDSSGWFYTPGRSDIKTITGDHPAVFGFDLTDINPDWDVDPYLKNLIPKIREAYALGGVITLSWHAYNPITNEKWYNGEPVSDIIPGGKSAHLLDDLLDIIADKLGNLTDENGRSIPIIFRPWHEHNGSHFWWGESRCTKEEYITLFRHTVDYLKNVKGVHNFLYAYSPVDWYNSFENYMDRYPGDAYVDVLGLDSYGHSDEEYAQRLSFYFREMTAYAEKHNKIAALTEIGYKKNEKTPGLKYSDDPKWLTDVILKSVTRDAQTKKIAYAVFWRNEAYNPTDYYLPHPGSAHEANLVDLYRDPFTLFAQDLDELYAP